MLTTTALLVREERAKLAAATAALAAYKASVDSTHFPDAAHDPHAADEEGNPLHFVMKNPPVPTPPPPPPPPPPPRTVTPLPPCSYEREWMDFASERSQREYKRLYKLYGKYLGRAEEGLVKLWRDLGGVKYWRTQLRPSQLTLLLSREEKLDVLKFRLREDELLAFGGEVMTDLEVKKPEKELVGFCSHLLPRLPYLRHLTIMESPVFPFDLKVLDAVSFSFPELEYVHLPLVVCKGWEVMGFIQRVPTLAKKDGLWIDAELFTRGVDITEPAFVKGTRGRLTIRAKEDVLLIT